jgi:hypothetical protein
MLEREQLLALAGMAVVYILLGIYIRFTYILPFFIDDNSIKYLVSAATGATNAWRPAGYSRTVQLLHYISPSLTWYFVSFYVINAGANLFFVFTVRYLCRHLNRIIFYLFAALVITCPTILFCTNGVTNEGLYASFTMLFIAVGMHLVAKPNGGWDKIDLLKTAGFVFAFHALFLVIYATCYNAATFLPAALLILVLWLSKERRHICWYKFLLLLLPFAAYYYIHGKLKASYKSSFKVETISSYSGWQKMNNIIAMIPHVREMDLDMLRKDESRELYHFLMQFPDSVYTEDIMMSNEMLANNRMPLRQFLFYKLQEDQVPYSIGWAKVGVVFEEFADDLSSHFPLLFARKYLLPSAVSHYHFFDILEWKNPVISENVINKYFNSNLLPDGASYYHNGTIFPTLNSTRHVAHYLYTALLTLTMAYFILRSRWFYRRNKNSSFWLLCVLNYFLLIAVVTRVFIEPTTSWRLGLFYYAPSMAFMAMLLNEIWTNYRACKARKQQASAPAPKAFDTVEFSI